MKKSFFNEDQMVKILREADTASVAEVAKKHGVSEQTIYLWRKRFGKLEAVDVRRLRQIEGENAKLKKLLAERDLEIEVMKEINAKMYGPPRVCKWLSSRVRQIGLPKCIRPTCGTSVPGLDGDPRTSGLTNGSVS